MRRILIPLVCLAVLLPALCFGQYGYPRRSRTGPATANGGPYNGPAVTFHGVVKALTKKEIIIDLDGAEPDGEQTLTLRRSGKTKFFKNDQEIKSSDIAVGTHVTLDATREGDMKLLALNVMIAPPAAAPPGAGK